MLVGYSKISEIAFRHQQFMLVGYSKISEIAFWWGGHFHYPSRPRPGGWVAPTGRAHPRGSTRALCARLCPTVPDCATVRPAPAPAATVRLCPAPARLCDCAPCPCPTVVQHATVGCPEHDSSKHRCAKGIKAIVAGIRKTVAPLDIHNC
jgi:hypothetical protein